MGVILMGLLTTSLVPKKLNWRKKNFPNNVGLLLNVWKLMSGFF